MLEKAEADKKAREAKLQAWQRKMGDAGIPERFQNRSLKNFIAETPSQKYALTFSLAYADGFEEVLKKGRSAVFIGKPGTGKTHLSTSIGLRIMRRYNRTVLFTSVLRAVRRIKETWRKDSKETESEATEALVFPDLLILDEVGQQFGTYAEKLILFDVLNGRYEKRKPTLLLANIPLDDYKEKGLIKPGLKSFLGDRIMDRLSEDGGEFVVFDWESKRS
ncbi:ATP-binding protein [Mycoavidus sp. SF9855]|uniref:ATP-binding protein n=1 Tax=Mycoavidus sp. SF9855 TaxID=2968475 RepID=UPI00211C5C14|nr:ATP-binding protein [Mycoavidus sp. SF9855]UUM20949.1 ATP-binding protein [Mycoavidus sp. SF9855]